MKKELSALVIDLNSAKNDQALLRVLQEHGSTFATMGWEIPPDAVSLRAKRQGIVQAAFAAIAGRQFASLDEHGRVKGAPAAPKKEHLWTATVLDERGQIATYQAEVVEPKTGRLVKETRELRKGFDHLQRAEDWGFRNMLAHGGPNWTCRITTSGCEVARKFQRDWNALDPEVTRRVWGDTRPRQAARVTVARAPKRGGEMKVSQTHAKFSRG